jgi:hypothetical protein
MAENKHTPVPLFVRQPDVWPFDIDVVDLDDNIIWNERRIAHGSRQRNLAQCMAAVGFPHDERPKIVALLERQLADAHLRAAAPDMLEALKGLDAYWTEDFPKGPDGPRTHGFGEVSEDTMQVWRNVRSAIAKAEGRAIAACDEVKP